MGAKFNLIQTNFTAGELSPRMLGRVDVVRYNNGAKALENVVVLIHGGVMRRMGTLYVAGTKDSTKRSRLIPYVFSRAQAYQLEFGEGYMRVFTADGAQVESSPGVPYEISTPYTEAQLPDIDFCQRADTMFLWHEDVAPQRLQRFGNADWRMMDTPFTCEPFDELGTRPATALSLSAATVGSGRTFTTGAATFLAADVGRTIEAGGGIAEITAINTAQSVQVDITSAFDGVNYASGDWLLNGSPQTTCSTTIKEPVGASTILGLDVDGWRSDDVGKYVVMNGGLLKITSYTSVTQVVAEIRVALAATVAAEANSWALCRSMWGQEFGYPRTGSIHQQRLHCAFSPGFPQDGWFSRLGEYYDFEIGTADDAGYNYRIDSDQASPGMHLASVRSLVALGASAEATLSGGGDPITPTTLDIQNQSAFGAGTPAPVRIGNELFFSSPAVDEETGERRDEIRALSADRFDSNNYAAPDISALAEHVTAGGVTDMDAQGNLLLALRSDGVIAAFRVDRDNDVVAASRWLTDGEFESISVVPRSNGARDVWAIVRRDVDGASVRYVERFVAGVYMDAAVEGASGPGATVWNGLDHLEGCTVAVRADGVVQPNTVVSGGQITLDRAANAVVIGLPFVPRIEMMNPEVQGPAGTIQGLPIRSPRVVLRVKDTLGATVNGQLVPFGKFTATLDAPPPPFTGDKEIAQLGLGERGRDDLVITQDIAAPFHLLAVIRQVDVTG